MTLSDKIIRDELYDILIVKDVKEFIEKLKEDFKESYTDSLFNKLKVKIDKLAGKELI